MIFPSWSTSIQNELETIPRCDLRVPQILSLENPFSVQRLIISDPYNIEASFNMFVDEFLASPFAVQLIYSKLTDYACVFDICRSPQGTLTIMVFYSENNLYFIINILKLYFRIICG